MYKKVILYVLLSFSLFFVFSGNTFAQSSTHDDEYGFGIGETDKDGKIVKEYDNVDARHAVLVGGVDAEQNNVDLLNVIRSFVNWTLGILGLVALSFFLYGGFLILTAGGKEEQYGKGRKFLKSALMGLIFIGLSWLLLSLIFWLIVTFTKDAMKVNA